VIFFVESVVVETLTGLSATPLIVISKSSTKNMEFIKEFFDFLRSQKKLWLLPIIIVIILIGTVLVAAQGSVMAPFIYTFF